METRGWILSITDWIQVANHYIHLTLSGLHMKNRVIWGVPRGPPPLNNTEFQLKKKESLQVGWNSFPSFLHGGDRRGSLAAELPVLHTCAHLCTLVHCPAKSRAQSSGSVFAACSDTGWIGLILFMEV